MYVGIIIFSGWESVQIDQSDAMVNSWINCEEYYKNMQWLY